MNEREQWIEIWRAWGMTEKEAIRAEEPEGTRTPFVSVMTPAEVCVVMGIESIEIVFRKEITHECLAATHQFGCVGCVRLRT